ncbi:peptide chain release factor 2 [bacterium]|nr:peptide chain release factor 2 [bacterium]
MDIQDLKERLNTIRGSLDLVKKEAELEKLNKEASAEDLWSDPDHARILTKRISHLSEPIEKWNKLSADLDDISELYDLLEHQSGQDYQDLVVELEKMEAQISEWEFLCMLGGRDDNSACILTIHPGAGGTESADWAGMVLRMYLRYAERKNFKTEVIDLQPSEQAGIKSASIEVEGEFAFGRLKSESGVHRLVRISPFDAASRRHTSFCSVFVYPESEELGEIVIDPNDLRIDTYRASGAGGQHVNKTDSAVRMTHIPTGIVATCQSERSQHRNRDSALKFLKAKLLKQQREEEDKKRDDLESKKDEIAWGSQIRSYVLHPYNMVKDHRTDAETSNTTAVLDGDLDQFIEAYLMKIIGK